MRDEVWVWLPPHRADVTTIQVLFWLTLIAFAFVGAGVVLRWR